MLKKILIGCCLFLVNYVLLIKSLNSVQYDIVNNRLAIIFTCLVFSVVPILIFDFIKKQYFELKKEYNDNKINEAIKLSSINYERLSNLNSNVKFTPCCNKVIEEREYSHKSFDRARASEIILYNIENNLNNLRDEIEKSLEIKKAYDNYYSKCITFVDEPTKKQLEGLSLTKEQYKEYEKKLLFNTIYKKENVYAFSVKVIVKYVTPAGRYYYDRQRTITFDQLSAIYKRWMNGKKYSQTSKESRRLVNDKLRYAVLKRDNFTCQKCGATRKDGVRLEVDHIIPVSKGGKSTMSNLQTLCERCNKGKSDGDN